MSAADGAVVGVTTVVDHGPAGSRFDIVVTGDGYRADELGLFATRVDEFCERLFDAAPFDVLRGVLNVHRLDVVSTDSGADDPLTCADGTTGDGSAPRTFFDATFCGGGGGSRRLLTVDAGAVLAAVGAAVPAYDMVFVQVNADRYGGSGGAVAVFSAHPAAAEIALHEMGHTAFGLADEYQAKVGCAQPDPGHDRHPGPEPDYPNVTVDPAVAKWADLVTPGAPLPTMTNPDPSRCDDRPSPVPAGTIGAFEGADYHRSGVYRPEYDCRMRTLGVPFCGVCRREIRRQVLRYTGG